VRKIAATSSGSIFTADPPKLQDVQAPPKPETPTQPKMPTAPPRPPTQTQMPQAPPPPSQATPMSATSGGTPGPRVFNGVTVHPDAQGRYPIAGRRGLFHTVENRNPTIISPGSSGVDPRAAKSMDFQQHQEAKRRAAEQRAAQLPQASPPPPAPAAPMPQAPPPPAEPEVGYGPPLRTGAGAVEPLPGARSVEYGTRGEGRAQEPPLSYPDHGRGWNPQDDLDPRNRDARESLEQTDREHPEDGNLQSGVEDLTQPNAGIKYGPEAGLGSQPIADDEDRARRSLEGTYGQGLPPRQVQPPNTWPEEGPMPTDHQPEQPVVRTAQPPPAQPPPAQPGNINSPGVQDFTLPSAEWKDGPQAPPAPPPAPGLPQIPQWLQEVATTNPSQVAGEIADVVANTSPRDAVGWATGQDMAQSPARTPPAETPEPPEEVRPRGGNQVSGPLNQITNPAMFTAMPLALGGSSTARKVLSTPVALGLGGIGTAGDLAAGGRQAVEADRAYNARQVARGAGGALETAGNLFNMGVDPVGTAMGAVHNLTGAVKGMRDIHRSEVNTAQTAQQQEAHRQQMRTQGPDAQTGQQIGTAQQGHLQSGFVQPQDQAQVAVNAQIMQHGSQQDRQQRLAFNRHQDLQKRIATLRNSLMTGQRHPDIKQLPRLQQELQALEQQGVRTDWHQFAGR
jgi:hypothetical protein